MRAKTARIVIDRRTGQVESSSLPLNELSEKVTDYLIECCEEKFKAEEEKEQRLALIEFVRKMEEFLRK